jgi:hypothetical protein
VITGEGRNTEVFLESVAMLDPAIFDSATPGGHHSIDITSMVDVATPTTLRLQLATPPPPDDGKHALFLGTGDASRSIDRPVLLVRHCEPG